MHVSNGRRNTNFQILHFLIGACHTADGAYALLCELYRERKLVVDTMEAAKLREKASRLKAERLAASDDIEESLEGQAQLIEFEAHKKHSASLEVCLYDEVAFIQDCIDRIQPLRKYSNLEDKDAHEMAQRDEWKGELMRRAENHLITTGTIPPDQLDTMRMHPDFKEINKSIFEARKLIETGEELQPLLVDWQRNLMQLENKDDSTTSATVIDISSKRS